MCIRRGEFRLRIVCVFFFFFGYSAIFMCWIEFGLSYLFGCVWICRKTMPRWTEQVSVGSETGLVTADDGYNWRKYGQKDILGASFPR